MPPHAGGGPAAAKRAFRPGHGPAVCIKTEKSGASHALHTNKAVRSAFFGVPRPVVFLKKRGKNSTIKKYVQCGGP